MKFNAICAEEALYRNRKPAKKLGQVLTIQKQYIIPNGSNKKYEPPHARHDESTYSPQ